MEGDALQPGGAAGDGKAGPGVQEDSVSCCDLDQARCRQTDGPWSPDWIGTDLERFRVDCVFSMEVAKEWALAATPR